MSLWGSQQKQNGHTDDTAAADDTQPPTEHMARRSGDSGRREPTERDRLLPATNDNGNIARPPHADGYLDPDDPAV